MKKNPTRKSSADCFCGLYLRWHAIKRDFDFNKTFFWFSYRPSVSVSVSEHMCLCWSDRLSLAFLSPERPQMNSCPWCCFQTVMFSSLSESSRPHPPPPPPLDPPSHLNAVMIYPVCSHLCHRMLLCIWFMSLADGWTKGHRETDTGGGGTSAQKTLNRELSNAVCVLQF